MAAEKKRLETELQIAAKERESAAAAAAAREAEVSDKLQRLKAEAASSRGPSYALP